MRVDQDTRKFVSRRSSVQPRTQTLVRIMLYFSLLDDQPLIQLPVYPISVPSLQERESPVWLTVVHFVEHYCYSYRNDECDIICIITHFKALGWGG